MCAQMENLEKRVPNMENLKKKKVLWCICAEQGAWQLTAKKKTLSSWGYVLAKAGWEEIW